MVILYFSHFFQFTKPFVLKDNSFEDGRSLAELIFRNQYRDQYVSMLVSSYIQFILLEANLKSEINTAVFSIYQTIIENALDSTIDLNHILNSFSYSEDYIRMCFSKTFGMPPLKFLSKIRIDHARFMIEIYKGVVPLTEIAEKCGYNDYVYFSKQFKAQTGKSPRAYAKETSSLRQSP